MEPGHLFEPSKVPYQCTCGAPMDSWVHQVTAPVEHDHAGGKVSSSKVPDFHLIPTNALKRLAARFSLGVERKKEKAWNATTNNQDALTHKDWVLERISHVFNHALNLRDKIVADKPLDGDDDAAAIAWSGIFLCEATDALQATPEPQPEKASMLTEHPDFMYIRGLEKALRYNQAHSYIDILCGGNLTDMVRDGKLDYADVFAAITATPEQKLAALQKVMQK